MSKTVTLPGTGAKMPTVAFGTWTVWQNKSDVCQSVKDAIAAGYRHIDCAWAYFNEEEVGKAIKAKIADGTITREDIWVTTKVWDTFHGQERPLIGLRDSLSKLGLDYVDLALVHWPFPFKDSNSRDEAFPKGPDGKTIFDSHDLMDTWRGMEVCARAGLARNIGISNFNSQQIQRVLDIANIKPANIQIESNPTLTNEKLIAFARSKDLTVSCYAPLGAPGRPWQESTDPCAIKDPVVTGIAAKKGKSPGQVILRWHVQRGLAICVKSLNADRIKQNLDLFGFELTEEEMQQISGLNQNFRNYAEGIATEHPEYPFNIEF